MKRIAVLLSVACAAARAQQPPVFKSETEMVLVDAVVTDKKGGYVRDLSAKDFRVFADSKEQEIRSFSLESANEPLRLILFFDNSSMAVTDQIIVRNAAASFIDSTLANAPSSSSRMIAVVSFDGGLRVDQNFTADAARLKNAIHNQPLLTATPMARVPPSSTPGAAPALLNLARSLNAAPGRKAIVLFTAAGGLAAAPAGYITDLVQLANRARASFYPVLQPQPLVTDSDPSPGPVRGSGRGFQAPRPDSGAQDGSPYTLASGTGGFVIPPSNDPLPQLRKIGEEQAQTYVLGFSPPSGDKPDACHSLRVKVDVSGAKLLARSSYCASKPQDLLAESRVEQDLEKRAAAPQTEASTAIQAPYFYISPAVARVHAAVEVPTEALKFETVKGKPHIEINVLGIASTAGGTAARFSDIVKRDFDSQQDADAFRRSPLRYEKEFKIAPGKYTLTVVFSSGGASLGKAETQLEIPAREAGQLAASGLALGTELRQAADLGLDASLLDQTTALVAGGMQLIPAGSIRFAKADKVYCYFEVYPSGSAASVHLRVLDPKTGAVKWDAGEARVDAGGRPAVPIGLGIPIETLTPGSYLLSLTAADSAGHSVESRAPFTIH